MEMIGFRYSVTGAFGYAFYQKGRRLCTVSSLVVPSPTVYIHGPGGDWTSPFAASGPARYLYRTAPAGEACRIVREAGRYALRFGASVCHVYEREGAYAAYAGGRQLAAAIRIPPQEAGQIPPPAEGLYDDSEAYYHVDAVQGLPDDVLAAILAFPMVKFDG